MKISKAIILPQQPIQTQVSLMLHLRPMYCNVSLIYFFMVNGKIYINDSIDPSSCSVCHKIVNANPLNTENHFIVYRHFAPHTITSIYLFRRRLFSVPSFSKQQIYRFHYAQCYLEFSHVYENKWWVRQRAIIFWDVKRYWWDEKCFHVHWQPTLTYVDTF